MNVVFLFKQKTAYELRMSDGSSVRVLFRSAGVSAFLNLSAIQSYLWEGGQADPPTINFDGAVRLGRFVFEGDAQLGQQFGVTGDSYKFTRNYARLVYDEPEDFRRWYLGDRSEEHTSELQSLMRIPYAVFCLNTKPEKNTS